MLGLNARDPALRARFLALYHAAVPPTLFDRLRFIVCGQDWGKQAHSFWLKQGLVRPPPLPAVACAAFTPATLYQGPLHFKGPRLRRAGRRRRAAPAPR